MTPQTTWLLIEMAPTDGTEIIGFWDKSNVLGEVYCSEGIWFDDNSEAVSQPTHWIPKPGMP